MIARGVTELCETQTIAIFQAYSNNSGSNHGDTHDRRNQDVYAVTNLRYVARDRVGRKLNRVSSARLLSANLSSAKQRRDGFQTPALFPKKSKPVV